MRGNGELRLVRLLGLAIFCATGLIGTMNLRSAWAADAKGNAKGEVTSDALPEAKPSNNSSRSNRVANPLRAESDVAQRTSVGGAPESVRTATPISEPSLGTQSAERPAGKKGEQPKSAVVTDEAETRADKTPPAVVKGNAATNTAPTDQVPTGTLRGRINELLEQARAKTDWTEEVKGETIKRYQAALEWLKTAEDAEKKAAQYDQEIKQAADLVQRAREELASPPGEPRFESTATSGLAELEGELAQNQSQLEDVQAEFVEREEELKRRGVRKSELSKLLEETKARVEEAEQQWAAPVASGEAGEIAQARRSELEARRLAVRIQFQMYQAEAKRLDALADWFPLHRDLAQRGVNSVERRVAVLQQWVAEARRLESERQAAEARRQAELADPALADLAIMNTQLAEKRQDYADRITRVAAELSENEKRLTELNNVFQRARDKVAKAGHSTTVGLMLRKQREELPSLKRCQDRLSFVESEMPIVNLERLEIEDQRAALGDLDEAVEAAKKRLEDQQPEMYGEHLQLAVRDLFTSQRDLLDRLISELDTYLVELSELEVSNRRLVSQTMEFRAFTDEHVLWIRSTEPFQRKTWHKIPAGVLALMQPRPWVQLVKNSGLDTLREPWMALGVLGAVVALATGHAHLRRRVRHLCETRVNSVGWRFAPSLQALLLTGIGTATWPLLVWYFGWRMTTARETSDLGLALGPALQHGAMLSWTGGFLRSLCRRHGVAETFFDWAPVGLSLGRRSLRWLVWIGVPLACLVHIYQVFEQGAHAESLGRSAFVLAMGVLAAFTHATLRRHQNIFREAIARDPKGWLNQIRAVAHFVGMTLPLSLAALALVGYYYSAQQLAVRLQSTLGLGLSVLLVHAVVSRWFVVQRRRLTLQQVRERKQSAAEATDLHTTPPHVLARKDDGTDWSEVHEKLRLLLRQAVTVSVMLGAWFIWDDVLPALRIMDRVQLWVQTIEITETLEDGQGGIVHKTFPRDVPTTLRHGLIAVVILFATFVLGRNLPALLQITVLNQLPLDRGGRHAISVLSHYGVALTGVIAACRTLHIHWGSVQWLAAGITVGLGFGLQEIFANFVSGIILLFERPIRVGDVITLDDITGTVTSIRMRATTVTNWDCKELIVPNKALITGRLLNWTLSDTLNRIVIEVGLSYATDPSHAREILLETVRAHENVLSEPEPNATIDSFGESALNFVVRAYVANLDVRLMTVHELHVAIYRRLQAEGIEIAFPHRDVTVRHITDARDAFLDPAAGWKTHDVKRNEAA